jgi:ADP-ribose pyrophosphatase YjhB (NUDIX family)
MTGIGVAVAIIRDNQILLIQREDFEVWGLPGGEVDDGESLAQAAIREAHEETGFEVSLTRLVGLYSLPGWTNLNAHIALFAAEISGGELVRQSNETLDARFFAPDDLPDALIWWHRQRIVDALNNVGGSVAWTQHVPYPSGMTRQELYAHRDQSGLSRYDFFKQMNQPGQEILEVGR